MAKTRRTSSSFQEDAKSQLTAAASDLKKLIVMHYSCGIGGNEIAPKDIPVSHIVTQDAHRSDQQTFHGDERELLSSFSRFLREHAGYTWLLFGGRNEDWGLQHLALRYQSLHRKLLWKHAPKRVDLAQLLKDIYGKDYVDHPRLYELIRLNRLTDTGLLSSEEAADAFKKRETNRLIVSTRRKVRCVREIFKLAVEEELVVGSRKKRPVSTGGRRQPEERGRKVTSDVKKDAKIYDAWKMKSFPSYLDLANELVMGKREVKLAIDRERKRRERASQ